MAFCLLFYQTALVVLTSDQSLQIIKPLCFPSGSRVVPTRHQLTSSAFHTKVPLQEMRQSIWHARDAGTEPYRQDECVDEVMGCGDRVVEDEDNCIISG